MGTELVTMPVCPGEFAIIYKLVHLFAPNHGKVFSSFMTAHMPDREAQERDLHD